MYMMMVKKLVLKVDEAIVNAIEYNLNKEEKNEIKEKAKGFEMVNPMELIDRSPEPPKRLLKIC